MTGSFFVFEGIDGSGISTQVEAVRTYCERNEVPVYVTKEPTDGLTGGLIRAALEKRVSFEPSVLALLFAADRLDHLSHHVEPRLQEGDNVVSDRYYLSEFAYQSEEADLEWLRQVNSLCRQPDLTIFLDVPVRQAFGRWQSDQWRALDRLQLFETEETLTRVRQRYLDISEQLRTEGHHIEIVDGTGTVESVHDAVVTLIEPLLARRDSSSSATRPRSEATREIEARLGLRSSAG